MKKLNRRYSSFVTEYLYRLNATEAYWIVYKPKKRTTAGANGHKLLKIPEIAAEIDKRMTERSMSVNEALARTADIARGDIAQIMDITPLGFVLDMEKAERLGLTKLIKKIKQTTITTLAKDKNGEDRETHHLEIEMYSAAEALQVILRAHGVFAADTPIIAVGIKAYIGWTPEAWEKEVKKQKVIDAKVKKSNVV